MPRIGKGIEDKTRRKLLKDIWVDQITHPQS
jgi:hypothetical protein